MKRFVLIIGMVLCFTLIAEAGQIFSDDFNDGDMAGWSPKQGGWAVSGGDDKYLQSTSNPYSVIWDEESFGVNQKLQVDAYFDLNAGVNDQIAHLRLRTGENSGVNQPFWDTGYLAEVQIGQIAIQNTHIGGNPYIVKTLFGAGESPIDSTGWYTLSFEVMGTGSDTHFKLSVNDTSYFDEGYNNSISQLDSGYAGLGRLIKYDNFQSSTDVPEPATLLLFAVGVGGARLLKRRRTI
ncbi:MAG: PEP-CTERM sorting domain-containing protein [Phycisphaerae bacterium]|nr:PEP-CTERM sorting domain-containing protein [Phycisphaerae bacterium]